MGIYIYIYIYVDTSLRWYDELYDSLLSLNLPDSVTVDFMKITYNYRYNLNGHSLHW